MESEEKYKFKELAKKPKKKRFKITRVIFKTNKKFYKKQMNEKKKKPSFQLNKCKRIKTKQSKTDMNL
jgi:hypothetical protein